MVVWISILGFILIALIIGKLNLSIQFNREVRELVLQAKDISEKVYRETQLIGLPEPVQRYFRHVLKDGQNYISYVRVKHDGKFKPGVDKKWGNIKGEEYFTAERPGFVWKGSTPLFTARDMFIGDKGRLVVSLLSLWNIVDGKGEQYDQGELLRWLAESAWFPTNLLPSERLKWFPVDSHSAKFTFSYNNLALYFVVTISENGEITEMETKRYMEEKKLETWICKLSNYKELNEIVIPTTAEVIWRLAKGDNSYAKFNVTGITYNKKQYTKS